MGRNIRAAKPADAAAIAAVHVAGWRENYADMIAAELIAARTFERRLELWADVLHEPNRITFVACDDAGEVCGFASAVVLASPHDGFTSYLETLYLRSGAKGRGFGRALLSRIAEKLIERGYTKMALRVLRLNPARAFYEHLGARLLPNFTHEVGALDDVAYGFDRLELLAKGEQD
jgi:GNAT superfamily N-acetyltransferase